MRMSVLAHPEYAAVRNGDCNTIAVKGFGTVGSPTQAHLTHVAAGEGRMATVESAGSMTGAGVGIFDREHTVAKAGFNRWLVPPAALCIHLCIGMAYGFSVFWLPLSQALTAPASKEVCDGMSLATELFTTTCNWKVASLGWMYTLFFVILGISA